MSCHPFQQNKTTKEKHAVSIPLTVSAAFATITTAKPTPTGKEHASTTKAAPTTAPTKYDVPAIHPTTARDTAARTLDAPFSAAAKKNAITTPWGAMAYVANGEMK